MPTDVYLSFIAYACAATWLPGPNNILLAAAGQAGLKRCRPLLLGIWTGIITVMFLAAGFCSALEKAVPRIAPLFRYAGCAYILYLAWKTLVRKPADAADADASRPLLFRISSRTSRFCFLYSFPFSSLFQAFRFLSAVS